MANRLSSNIILTPDRLERVVDQFLQNPEMAFDVETTGKNRGVPHLAPVSWLALATDGLAVTVPMNHPNGDRLISRETKKLNKETRKFETIPPVWDAPPPHMKPSEAWPILEPLFTDPSRTLYAHGATFDNAVVTKYVGLPEARVVCTIVMQWLLDENRKTYKLKELVKFYFGHDYDKEHVGQCVEKYGFSKVARYGYLDVKYAWLMAKGFRPMLRRENMLDLLELESDITRVLTKMRLNGARIDREELEALYEQYADELIHLEGRVYKCAGKKFNLNSNPQKQQILFGPKRDGGQALKVHKKTKTGAPSTDGDALEPHKFNPVVAALSAYQDLSKLQSTYIEGYLGVEGDPKKPCQIFDGRIHADFVQYGTVTGRFSCRQPNLQNIPRPDTEKGKQIRGLFMAEPGEKLVVADYGQIELVVLAHYSRAKALVDGFNNGIDAHTMTASKVFGVPFDEVTKPMRQASKGINFAVVYGAGPDKVASMADVKVAEAKEFLQIHQREFPEIYRFKEDVLRVARSRKPPHIRTLLGRKRRLPALHYNQRDLRGEAERQAVNSLIQGSAADIIKTAMVRLDRTLPTHSTLILSIHDELVVRTPEEHAEEIEAIMKEAMLGKEISALLSVPMTTDSNIVDRWSEAK